MCVFYRYFLILIACISLLLGIQIPGFINQYEKRVDAYFLEATTDLHGYQEIAEKYFNGSIPELIKKHETNEDKKFKAETQSIKKIYEKYLKFKAQKESLNVNMARKVSFITLRGDRELINETYENYSYVMTLNKESVATGFIFAVLMLLIFELLKISIYWFFRSLKQSVMGIS